MVRWRWVASGLVCASVGCGSSVAIHDGTLPGTTSDAKITAEVFPDDTDPVMASQPFVAGELIVQPYPGADPTSLRSLFQRTGARVVGELDKVGLTILEVGSGRLDASAAQLGESDLIEAIHKNYLLQVQRRPSDSDIGLQSYLDRINAPQAWDRTVGAASTVVAVVDTGVQSDHPDLVDRIAGGWNVYDDSADFFDRAGHGTLVTGVLAASTNNALGVAGVTWSNPVLVVRATNATGQSTSRHVAAGILWAVGHGAKVINVSFAPLWSNAVVRSAARQAWSRGALVVISAGNSGGKTVARGYPEALFVGATDETNAIAFFSDRGPFVDLTAPGTAIRSTSLGGGYDPVDGTSFAAPMVAGVVALAWSMNPELRPVTIAEAIRDTAIDLGRAGRDDTYGHGIVDAGAAVDAAAESSFVPDKTPPTVRIARPDSGAVFTRRFVATVTAEDRWGIADVVMLVDDFPQATDTRSPYRFVLDPGNFAAGRHRLGFVATDLAGNASDVRSVSVVFSRRQAGGSSAANRITFKSPAPGAYVSGDVLISATVAAEAGLATIEWRVDGESVVVSALTGQSSGASFLWRTSEVPHGRHRITITITDFAGEHETASLQLVTG